MQNIEISNGQSVMDIALIAYGSIEGVLNLLRNNANLRLDSRLINGSYMIIDNVVIDQKVKSFYDSNEVRPATYVELDYPYWNGDFYQNDFNSDFK